MPSWFTRAGLAVCLFILGFTGGSSRPRPLLQRPFPEQLWRVGLNKQHVPVVRKGRVVSHKTAYSGTVLVGLPNPQTFTVLFDTGSGHIVLPSEQCASDVCKKHRRYQRALSSSAKDVEVAGGEDLAANTTHTPQQVDLQYGTGQVSGEFLEDAVCLGSGLRDARATEGCTRLRIVLASSLTSDPFDHFSFDGVVGLGLEGLALHEGFSFLGRLAESGNLPEPCFSVFLSKSDEPNRSEIIFGGHSKDLSTSAFHWAPVVEPEQGYWQVALRGVRIGDEPLSLCAAGGCRAVLDTGTSMLGVPEQSLSQMHRLLARVAEPAADCRGLLGPPIIFDLGGFELRLNAEDYSRPAPMSVKSRSGNMSYEVCRALLLPVPSHADDAEKSELFVFGEPFLQRHYTKYDWHKKRIGFALARQGKERGPQQVPPAQII